MNNTEKERQTAPKETDMTKPPATSSGACSHDPVELPIVRLEGRRRLHGAAWAAPFPPAAAAMPIDRSRPTRLIGTTIVALGAGLVMLTTAGVIPAHVSGLSLIGRIIGGAVTLMVLGAIALCRDGIDRWWLGVRSARAARRWPPVTVFGVLPNPRPGRERWAIVALHPQAHGRHHYTRRGVVLRELGPVSESDALEWHQQLQDINQLAATGRADTGQLLLTRQPSPTGDPPPRRRDRDEPAHQPAGTQPPG